MRKNVSIHTYFDVKLDALMLKNRALASEATAFAYEQQINSRIDSILIITSMVFPFPGGPNNRIPRTGARKPVNIY